MLSDRCAGSTRSSGFTLIEVLIVTGISVILMTVATMIYSSCLRVYRESQGLTDVFQTSKMINRDMRDYLGTVVPLKGNWINAVGSNIQGVANATATAIDYYYLDSKDAFGSKVGSGGAYKKSDAYQRNRDYDRHFSWAQAKVQSGTHSYGGWMDALGQRREGDLFPNKWNEISNEYGDETGWWLPAFFGDRDGSNATILEADDVRAGSWGWPRPDYRLDADADKLAEGNASLTDGGNVACWFYAEERFNNSGRTLALDHPNIVLASFKFSMFQVGGREVTKLSFLRHTIAGFDLHTQSRLRIDHTYGNMLRKVEIVPFYLDSAGSLKEAGDSELGWSLSSGGPVGAGGAVPCCFDVKYTLRNPGSNKSHKFALRVYQFGNPQ